MKIAIQQPYFFPYYTYFELINKVDLFVILDNVQYIRRGWINRNKIKNNQWIRIPVKHAPQSTLISKIKTKNDWIDTFKKTLLHTYGKKTIDHPVLNINQNDYLLPILIQTLQNTCLFLGIKTKFTLASDYLVSSTGEQRIIDLCNILKADNYLNLPGGKDLYKNIKTIEFLTSCENKLSILDLIFGDNLCQF